MTRIRATPSRAPRKVGANRVVVHTGAVTHAIWLLRWWADDESDDAGVLELIKQSKECARDLEQDLKKRGAGPIPKKAHT